MKLNAYAIFDTAAVAYLQPFFMHNDDLAVRAFRDNVNADTDSVISLHPEQFTLFKIGTFDDKSGTLERLETNQILGNGLEHKGQSQRTKDLQKTIRDELQKIRDILEDK